MFPDSEYTHPLLYTQNDIIHTTILSTNTIQTTLYLHLDNNKIFFFMFVCFNQK